MPGWMPLALTALLAQPLDPLADEDGRAVRRWVPVVPAMAVPPIPLPGPVPVPVPRPISPHGYRSIEWAPGTPLGVLWTAGVYDDDGRRTEAAVGGLLGVRIAEHAGLCDFARWDVLRTPVDCGDGPACGLLGTVFIGSDWAVDVGADLGPGGARLSARLHYFPVHGFSYSVGVDSAANGPVVGFRESEDD